MDRPWNQIPIIDCGEKLIKLSEDLFLLEPHPYVSLGAPYGKFLDPWRLRHGVISRLVLAQEYLKRREPKLVLAIFDAWRPIPVQEFMVEHTVNEECLKRKINRFDPENALILREIILNVETFWAPPSKDPLMPPPHSTGAAVDITLCNTDGMLLDMGGEIDHIGPISAPNYYLEDASTNSQANLWNSRRNLLCEVMIEAGFCQHSHEWWHFSYGDQLWAWKSGNANAIYGNYISH